MDLVRIVFFSVVSHTTHRYSLAIYSWRATVAVGVSGQVRPGNLSGANQQKSAEIGSDVESDHAIKSSAVSTKRQGGRHQWWRTGDKRGVFLEVSVCQMLTTFNSTATALRSSGANLQFQVSF